MAFAQHTLSKRFAVCKDFNTCKLCLLCPTQEMYQEILNVKALPEKWCEAWKVRLKVWWHIDDTTAVSDSSVRGIPSNLLVARSDMIGCRNPKCSRLNIVSGCHTGSGCAVTYLLCQGGSTFWWWGIVSWISSIKSCLPCTSADYRLEGCMFKYVGVEVFMPSTLA
jgi:hypothetical protein